MISYTVTTCRRWAGVIVLLSIIFLPSYGQTNPIAGTDIRPLTLSGSIGMLAEAYGVSGIEGRRAPTSMQVFANTSFSLFGLRSGVNVLYSTDDSNLRQSMNRFSFNGSWRWISLGAGDVSPSFSKYSLSGVTVRGGLIELNPGSSILSFTAGQTQRAVEPSEEFGFREPAYSRMLYGARIGYGRQEGSHFHLITVYAKDDVNSISTPSVQITPAENVSITPDIGLSLFSNRIVLQSQVTVSVFTRDLRSEPIDLSDTSVPDFLTNIFTPRNSTRADYAGEASLQLNFDPVTIRGSYERVQPGFRSLGIGQIRSDRESIRVQPQVQLLERRLTVGFDYSQHRNNLLGTRISTLHRNQYGVNVRAMITRAFSIQSNFALMKHENRPDEGVENASALHQDLNTSNLTITPMLTIMAGELTHSVSLSGSYQAMTDKSMRVLEGMQPGSDFDNLSTTLTYALAFQSGLSVNVSGNYVRTETEITTNSVVGGNLGIGYGFFNQTLMVNGSAGLNQNQSETVSMGINGNDESFFKSSNRQLVFNLNTTYRLPNGNALRFMIRNTDSSAGGAFGQAYNETHASLRYEHRF